MPNSSSLKTQVTSIVHDVISDPTNRRVTVLPDEAEKKKKAKKES